jgi:hypothetical protein
VLLVKLVVPFFDFRSGVVASLLADRCDLKKLGERYSQPLGLNLLGSRLLPNSGRGRIEIASEI